MHDPRAIPSCNREKKKEENRNSGSCVPVFMGEENNERTDNPRYTDPFRSGRIPGNE